MRARGVPGCVCVCVGGGGGGGGGGALGVRPSSLALSSLMMSVHAAPSVKYEAVAAVTVPCGLTKAGLSLAMLSGVESPAQPEASARQGSGSGSGSGSG